jgi:hypothetical protein
MFDPEKYKEWLKDRIAFCEKEADVWDRKYVNSEKNYYLSMCEAYEKALRKLEEMRDTD